MKNELKKGLCYNNNIIFLFLTFANLSMILSISTSFSL